MKMWLYSTYALVLPGLVFAQATAPPFVITTGATLPNATSQVAYSQQLATSGGSPPISWSLASGSLPPNLNLGSSGAITGTPPQTASGTFTFTVLAVDAQKRMARQTFSLTVVQPPLTITTGSPLPNGNVGTAYSATLSATGGSGGYSWSSTGSPPPGLSVTSGRVAGTPTAAGVYTFGISVSDSQQHTASKQFTLTIQALPITITSNSPLPNGAVGAPYNYIFDGTGGVKPYTWSVTGAGLPAGLTLGSNGSLSGTPTTAGQYSFAVRADSAQSQGAGGATKAFSLRITEPVTVTTASPINATIGAALTVVMTATGGTPLYLWQVAQGSQLPPGFTLDTSSGFLSGTPTTAGTFNFTVQATDGASNTATKALVMIVQAGLAITTASPLPAAASGVTYSVTLSVSGGTAPFTWAVDSGALPAGVTLNPTTGVLGGAPQATGTFSFVIRVTDNARATGTKSFALTVGVSTPAQISVSALDFVAPAGGDAPAPQSLALITPSAQTLQFTIQMDGGAAGVPAPAWLLIRLLRGSTPARIPVATDPTGLPAGRYTARILVNTSDGRQNIVTVALTLTASAPQLEVSPDSLRFAGSVSALAASEQNLLVRNAGGGGALAFQAEVVGDAPWVRVLPGAGQAGPGSPVFLRVLVSAQGLPVGPARASIRVRSEAAAVEIPVSLLVREEGPVIGFNVTGQRFEARDGSGTTRSKNINILNLGTGVVNWQAEIVSGSEFVTLGATSGLATPAAPGVLALSVNPGARRSGNYYGLIRIAAAGAINSPQFLTAMLAIADENSPPEPDPTPSGLFFIGKTGAAPPAAQVLRVFTSSSTPVPFQLSANASDGGTWLSVSASSGTASTSTPAQVNVTVTPGALSPGVYTGDITASLSTTSIRSTNVTLVVQPATAVSAAVSSKTRPVTGCTPTRLAVTQAGLVNSFAAPVGWPSSIVVRLADDCGDPAPNGQVITTFSNGDPALALRLADAGAGLYSGTWAPGRTAAHVTVSARAAAPNLAAATAEITGAVTPNKVPILAPSGALNTFNPLVGAPLAPGAIAQVYGSNLATTTAAPGVIPLVSRFNGTRVLIGAVEAALVYLSDSQLSVQIPTELLPDKEYSVVVEANGGYTLPHTLTTAAAQPGVLTLSDKSLFALHAADYSLVTPGSPARQGETIALYLVGMGRTNPPMASGAAAPLGRLTPAATQPAVTIDGKIAAVAYAGLMPGTVGLYQIFVTVPAGVAPGSVPVTITQGGAAANASTLAVR